MSLPICPSCDFAYPYEEQGKWICSNCGHTRSEQEQTQDTNSREIVDSNGTPLQDGDSVIVIKDLKFKG